MGTHIDLIDPVTSQPEYPAAIEILGVRMHLERETRFSRIYCSTESFLPHPQTHIVSRFVDGSAPILTLQMLKAEWASWSEEDRLISVLNANVFLTLNAITLMTTRIYQRWFGSSLSVARQKYGMPLRARLPDFCPTMKCIIG